MPDAAAEGETTFIENNSRTTLTITVQHTSRAHRDAHINSGMEAGMQVAMDHLEAVAISLG